MTRSADQASFEPVEDVVQPINWNSLCADEAEHAWLDLNRWVDWLRHTYGLPPAVVPPLWHRHDELVWELSALHLHWLNSYDPDASPSAPLAWHRDFADARHRLREWVSTCGSRLDRDRPTRHTAWPGEVPPQSEPETPVANRAEDFVAFVLEDLNGRRNAAKGKQNGIDSQLHPGSPSARLPHLAAAATADLASSPR